MFVYVVQQAEHEDDVTHLGVVNGGCDVIAAWSGAYFRHECCRMRNVSEGT